MARHSFTNEQRNNLRKQKLTSKQIDALEKSALHVIASAAEPFRYGEFRKPLNDIEKQARRLALGIERLRASPSAGEREAYWRLLEADGARKAQGHLANRDGGNRENPALGELTVELRRLAELAKTVLSTVKGRQGRHRTAHHYPVRVIVETLLETWRAEHAREGELLPPYDLKVSATPNSRFRKIVAICYQAAGHPNKEPERAIDAYQDDEKKQDAWLEGLALQSRATRLKRTVAPNKRTPTVR